MISPRHLILDIDFTLIHLEAQPGAIEVPGRTRSAYLGPRTIELLHELQTKVDLILATARSWDGTRWVVEGLAAHGVKISGMVLEDGALLGWAGQIEPWEPRDWEALRAQVDAAKTPAWPDFEWQYDFKACLVARCPDRDQAATLMEIFANLTPPEANLRFYRDGRKIYFLSQAADKWSALQRLLGDAAVLAAGIGDGKNDLCWLPNIALPATFACGDPGLISAIQSRSGYLTSQESHSGIADILQRFLSNDKVFSGS